MPRKNAPEFFYDEKSDYIASESKIPTQISGHLCTARPKRSAERKPSKRQKLLSRLQ